MSEDQHPRIGAHRGRQRLAEIQAQQ